MKKKIFGIPALALVLGLLVVGGATAALLSYFGSVEQTTTVKQGLTLDGNDWDVPVETSLDDLYSNVGGIVSSNHKLINNADIDSKVNIVRTDCVGEGSCDEIETKFYDNVVNKIKLVEAGDLESEDFGDLYVTTTPTENTVIYEIEVPSDYFETSVANLNLQVSLTNSEDENNFQVIYYPSEEHKWKFLSPSLNSDNIVEGKENIEELDEVVSLDFIENDGDNSIIKIVLNRPAVQQSFGVQSTDGGEGYRDISTPNWEDKDGEDNIYQYGGFSEQGTESHEQVVKELTQPVTVPANSEVDFVIANKFPVGVNPGDYVITSEIQLN